MAQFLTFGNYSREGVAGLLDPSAPDRKTVLAAAIEGMGAKLIDCLLYTSPSPRDRQKSRMPSSA